MTTALRFLSCAIAFSLALPPGWCCAVLVRKIDAASAAPTPAPVKHSCCQAEAPPAPKSAPTPEKMPCQQPGLKCCCEFNATAPPTPEKGTPDLTTSLPFVPDAPTAIQVPLAAVESIATACPTPNLHILQCVWRC